MHEIEQFCLLTAKSGKIRPLFIKITLIKELSQFY